jgi:ketosteroid isomerase-like protein
MPEESTTPNLVELTRRALEASNHGGVDSALTYFAPDAVWSVGPGLERFEGKAAIRRFWTEWRSTFDDYSVDMEEALDLGGGVALATLRNRGRPISGGFDMQEPFTLVIEWTDGLITRVSGYHDPDEARAAAELLAQERG